MRIVLVSGIFPPDIGGPATHTDDLRQELAERGHAVTVVTLWDGPCVSVRPGIVRFPRRWSWPVRQAAVAAWLIRHGRSIDAVYATGMLPAAVAGARLAGRPVVVKVVGDPVWERGRRMGLTGEDFERFQREPVAAGRLDAMRRLRNWSLRRSSVITAPSAYLVEVVDGWLGGPSDVTVIPNGVRVPQEETVSNARSDDLRLVFVGRLVAHKQVDRIVRAAAATPGVSLEIVGTGPEGDALTGLAHDLGTAGRVAFVGDLPHTAVLRSIAAADALLLASDYEGLPHVVLEALAVGTPVVSPPVGGVAEVLEDGVSGLLLADARVATIEAALSRLRDDAPLRTRLHAGAREAGTQWTMARTATDVERAIAVSRQLRPTIVTLGRARWPDVLTSDLRHRLGSMVRHEDPTFVQTGRAGVRYAGRARAILFPADGPLASALFYAVAPIVAVAVAAGRRPAAVACQSPYEGIGAVAAARLLPASRRPRVVIEVHGDWRTASGGYGGGTFRSRIGPRAALAARWALRRADRVRVISAFTEGLVREAGYRGPVDRYIAHTDAGPLVARPPVAPPASCAVGFIGALERTKGIDVLLDAWRDVYRRVPEATLEVAGDGALREALAREARGLGIRLLGSIPHEQVSDLLDGVRLLVVPSRSEGLGRVVWEAFARSRPVVASAVGGIPEQVRDGETGLLVPPEDPVALADAIVSMLTDPQGCAAMGSAARRAAEDRDPDREFEGGIARRAAWVGQR